MYKIINYAPESKSAMGYQRNPQFNNHTRRKREESKFVMKCND